MNLLICGIGLFCVAFLLHFILWRIRLPNRQIKALLQIFFGTLIAGLLFFWQAPSSIKAVISFETLLQYIHVSLLFVSITFVYIELYSTLETDSPSLIMVNHIAGAGQDGIDHKLFKESMAPMLNDHIIMNRMEYIIIDKMVYVQNGKYQLTRKGRLFVQIFILFRKLLNTNKKYG